MESVSQDVSVQLLILYAVLALGVSFLCSIAEAVLLSVTPSYLAQLRVEGRRCARRLTRLKRSIDRPLAAILSLNTIANTAGAAGVGAQAAHVFGSRSIGVVSAALTFLILVFSEIIPKTLGAMHWRTLAPAVGRAVDGLAWAFHPLVLLSDRIARLLGRNRAAYTFSRLEFAALAQMASDLGELTAKECRVLENLFRFHSYKVREIMTPRTVVFLLPADQTIEETVRTHGDVPFSRIPLFGKNTDDIIGFVLKTDILLRSTRDEGKATLRSIARRMAVLPVAATLFQAFDMLVGRREHIALVVDEYGGMEGIVTLEDIVETLLGLEIVDEEDVTADMRTLALMRRERTSSKRQREDTG